MILVQFVFIVLVLTTFFSNGVQAYIHFEAYPLIPFVGKAEFSTYLKEYEQRLTIPLLVPYGLTILSNLTLIFIHPLYLSVVWVIVALLLNIAVPLVTLRIATPIYNQIKQNGVATPSEMTRLLRVNLLRLELSTISSVVVVIMLFAMLKIT